MRSQTPYYRKPFKSLAEMEKELGQRYTPNWGNQLSTRALLYACKRLDEIAASLAGKRRKSRTSSAWNRFVSKGLKSGKALKQIGQEWRALKASR